jgi:hypothetical protein
VAAGGLITYLMQRLNYRQLRQQEEAAKRTRDLTTAISVLMKAAKMFSDLTQIKAYIDEAVTRARS